MKNVNSNNLTFVLYNMINLLFHLSLYQNTITSTSPTYFNAINNMTYGFKRNSQVFINISDLSTPIVFGLGTNKEINDLKAKNTCYQYCQGSEKVSGIQYYIIENTSINFTVPTKSVLTPFSISCEEIYIYKISLNILNGNDHLDYRYQNIITINIVFTVLFFMEPIIFSIFLYFFSKSYCCGNFFMFLFFCSAPHAAQSILQMINYLKNKNNEMQLENEFYTYETICYLIYLLFFIFLDIVGMFRYKCFNHISDIILFISYLLALSFIPVCCFKVHSYFKFADYLVWLILFSLAIFLSLYSTILLFLKISFALNSIISFIYFSMIFFYFCDYSEKSNYEQGKTLTILCLLTRITYFIADAFAIIELNNICEEKEQIENDNNELSI